MPVTENLPKVLVPLVGRPVIEYLIEDLSRLNIKELVVVVGHKSDLVRDHLGDGSKLGVNLSYVHQRRLTGEADALLAAEDALRNDESFLMVDGDFVADTSMIESTIRLGLDKDADIAVALTKVRDPSQYGVVKLGRDNRVLEVIEKPSKAEAPSNLAVSGVYVFKRPIFDALREIRHLEPAMSSMMKTGAKAYGLIWEGGWIDIGRPWDLLRANKFLMERKFVADRKYKDPSAIIAQSATFDEPFYVGPNVRIMDNARVKGACIDEGATIGTNSLVRDYSYIGKKSLVGFTSEVKGSIIMEETNIGHLAYVGDSIIGRGCEIGAGAITANTRFDQRSVMMYIDGKKVDTGRVRFGAVVGDNVQIGINVSIYPGRKIGCGAWIRPGSVVIRDVPPKRRKESQSHESLELSVSDGR